MNFIEKLQSYGDTHQNVFLDILRIMLGVVLVLKGYYYIANTDELNSFLLENDFHL